MGVPNVSWLIRHCIISTIYNQLALAYIFFKVCVKCVFLTGIPVI